MKGWLPTTLGRFHSSKDVDCLIDALIAIQLQDPKRRDDVCFATINEHQELLSGKSLDVVLLTGMNSYISPLEFQWIRRYSGHKSKKTWLALSALLLACTDHEIGHWVQNLQDQLSCYLTLTVYKEGYFSDRSKLRPLDLLKDTY
jgi:hypothetical protein